MTDSIFPLPQLTTGQERTDAILNHTNGVIVFDSSSIYPGHVENAYPIWGASGLGYSAVKGNQEAITLYANANHIDPNLLAAVVYMENAHGYYDLGLFGATEGPGNINLSMWSGLLGLTPQDFRGNPSLNISLAARILAEIKGRLIDPTPEAIATLYNSMKRDMVSDYGLSVARLMKEHPWTAMRCFTGETSVMMSDGQSKAIKNIKVGDVVMSFDPAADGGRGALVPKRVKRLFRNTTTEWIKLTWLENGEAKELVATPGHHMLDKTGAFMRLDLMVQNGKAEIVLASGEVVEPKPNTSPIPPKQPTCLSRPLLTLNPLPMALFV
jgi:hypothetical protein